MTPLPSMSRFILDPHKISSHFCLNARWVRPIFKHLIMSSGSPHRIETPSLTNLHLWRSQSDKWGLCLHQSVLIFHPSTHFKCSIIVLPVPELLTAFFWVGVLHVSIHMNHCTLGVPPVFIYFYLFHRLLLGMWRIIDLAISAHVRPFLNLRRSSSGAKVAGAFTANC